MMEKKSYLLRYVTRTVTFIIELVERFFDNHCPQLAAALAYYAIFSIPPLLILIVTVIGSFLDASSVSDVIRQSTSSVLAPKVAEQLIEMLEQANEFARTGSWWSVALSIFGILFGATSGFYQLQTALNRTWSIRPEPGTNFLKILVLKRLFSFAMVAITISLLVVMIITSASIAFFGEQLEPFIPDFFASTISQGSTIAVSFIVTTGMLAAIYKFLPDAQINWGQVFPGAVFAAFLFLALHSVTTFYLSQLRLDDTFGQAGSFALLLVWLYVCAHVVFLGATFSRVWCGRRGDPVRPDAGAIQDEQPPSIFSSKVQEKFEAWQ